MTTPRDGSPAISTDELGAHDPPTPASGARAPQRRDAAGRDPAPGLVIAGKYRLEHVLKQGGMGAVWVATHVDLETQVAVKFIDKRLLGGDDSASSGPADSAVSSRVRFEREAKAAAQLRMSNVVQVFDYGVDSGLPYLVMELLQGEDLGARLRRVRRLSLAEAARVLLPVARALQHAHDGGLVHRDLKPANIFLARDGDDEVPKVLDFGVAKALGGNVGAAESTTAGTIVGTPHYASPEQATGSRPVDARSDLWSLGVVSFRAITGKKPFQSRGMIEAIVEICSAPVPSATSIAPDLPPEVDAFFVRALARDPDARFQSAREFASALGRLATVPGSESAARVVAPPTDVPAADVPDDAVTTVRVAESDDRASASVDTPLPPPRSRFRILVVGAGLLGAAAIALGVASALRDDAPAPQPGAASAEVGLAPAPPAPPASEAAPVPAEAETSVVPPTPPAPSSAGPPAKRGPPAVRTGTPKDRKPQRKGEEVLGY